MKDSRSYPPSLSRAARGLRRAVNDFDAERPDLRPLTESLRSATNEALSALEWGHDFIAHQSVAPAHRFERALRQIVDPHLLRRLSDARRIANEALDAASKGNS